MSITDTTTPSVTGQAGSTCAAQRSDHAAGGDLTGRDRMARNVLTSWAAHFIYIAAGFIVPRLIDRQIGQESLGVWDFGWSLVAYFALVQGGVVSSVNRFVSMCRSKGDLEGVNCAVSSVTAVLLVMALVAAALALSATLAIPALFGDRLGGHIVDAQWVTLLLGTNLAIEIAFAGFGGVLTGCYRHDLNNLIFALSHVLQVAAMVVALFLGGSISTLALIVFCGGLLERWVQRAAAYRVCRSLRVGLTHARWSMALQMLRFGSKWFLPALADVLQGQTTSILIVAYLGPSALALYSRPRSIVLHMRTLMAKFAFVLLPTASSLQAMNRDEELRGLFVTTARYGACIALPMVLGCSILGGPILRLWMGPHYELGILMAILAVGHLASILQMPVLCVLSGMNAHGRPGLATLLAAICSGGLTILALGPLQWGLLGAAVALTVPLTVAHAIYVPVYACRRLGVSLGQYAREALFRPLLYTLPFAMALGAARLVFADRPVASLLSAVAVGGPLLAIMYWRYALAGPLKRQIAGWIGLPTIAAEVGRE